MDCTQVRDILFDYLDAEVPLEVRERVETHLAGCASCAARVAAWREQAEALGRLPRLPAPAGFLHRVHARTQEPAEEGGLRARLTRRHFLEAAGLAAAAALVLVTVQVAWRDPPGPLPSTRQLSPPAPPPAAAPAKPEPLGRAGEAIPPREDKPEEIAPEPSAVPPESWQGLVTLRLPGRSGGERVQEAPRRGRAEDGQALRSTAPPVASPEAETQGDTAKSKATAPGPGHDEEHPLVSRVKRAVAGVDGRVLSVEQGRGVLPGSVLVEVPAGSTSALLDALRSMGRVELSEDAPPPLEATVRLQITFAFE